MGLDVVGVRECVFSVHNTNVNQQHDNKFYGTTTTTISLFVFRVDNARDSCSRRFLRWGVAGSREFLDWRARGGVRAPRIRWKTSKGRHYPFRLYRVIFRLLNIMKTEKYIFYNVIEYFNVVVGRNYRKPPDWREVEVRAAAVPFEYYSLLLLQRFICIF